MLGNEKESEEDLDEREEHMILLQLAKEREELSNVAFNFFKKNTAHIEVLREDNHLEKTYFSIPPFCSAISEVRYLNKDHFLICKQETKKKFNQEVDRISAKSKCMFLLKEADQYIEIIKFEYW